MLKNDILLSIAQFEDLYTEWEDYKIKMLGDSHVSVYDKSGEEEYSLPEAKELLTDFKGVLKKNNLMISSTSKNRAKISTYIYSFEVEYEKLADLIERHFSAVITNLNITTGKNGRPKVKFQYSTNMTSGEKSKIKKTIEKLVDEYQSEKNY